MDNSQAPALAPSVASAGVPVDTSARAPGDRFVAWRERIGDDQALEEIGDYIVGGGSLHAFCGEHGFGYFRALRWLDASPARKAAYDRAREDRAHIQADQVVEVSRRDCSMPVLDNEGNVVGSRVDPGAVQQAKLEADSLKWTAARMNVKYADKVQIDANLNVREASNEQLAAELAKLGLSVVAQAMLPKPEGE